MPSEACSCCNAPASICANRHWICEWCCARVAALLVAERSGNREVPPLSRETARVHADLSTAYQELGLPEDARNEACAAIAGDPSRALKLGALALGATTPRLWRKLLDPPVIH